MLCSVNDTSKIPLECDDSCCKLIQNKLKETIKLEKKDHIRSTKYQHIGQ